MRKEPRLRQIDRAKTRPSLGGYPKQRAVLDARAQGEVEVGDKTVTFEEPRNQFGAERPQGSAMEGLDGIEALAGE